MPSTSSDIPPPAAALVETAWPQMPPKAAAGKHSYGQILKSSALIGGSSAVNIVAGIVRTKVMAVLLGGAGVGLLSLYDSILGLTQSIAGMGINSSGVRQIAVAEGSGETQRVARTAAVLRRTSVFLGILGAVLLIVLCRPVSTWTFGSSEFAAPVALLSLAVLFRAISDGQGALIQGMRRISDLARIGVWGALFGTVVSVGLVYFFREKGIVPSLVSVAAITLIISWWYRRKIQMPAASLTASQMGQEAAALLKLGSAFMASAVLTLGAAYAIRFIVRKVISLDAVGYYHSAWVLGGLYVGFILQAMGADFYPRLTAASRDNLESNRLVNEQAQISLLLAGPGMIATLTLAPLVIALFYSAEFTAAVDILRWICLGMTLRVIAWPMGYIVVARGEQKIFFWTEVAATVVHVGLAWLFIKQFGLTGAGAAFFGLYVWHGILIYVIVHRLTGFRWSPANRKIGVLFLSLTGLVFAGFYVFPVWLATTVGALATVLSGVYSVRVLVSLVPLDRIPGPIRWLLTLFRFAPASSRSKR